MNSKAQQVAYFGLLTALALVLGFVERQIGGDIGYGIKLGLANTVLLYAIYLMDWKSATFLMLTKVGLSALTFNMFNVILLSLLGGVLSLITMLLVKKNPARGALGIFFVGVISEVLLLCFTSKFEGKRLVALILLAVFCVASIIFWILIQKGKIKGVIATSVAGAIAHNIGQILAVIVTTPGSTALLYTYLPVLIGIGTGVGSLTGVIAFSVFKALHVNQEKSEGEK